MVLAVIGPAEAVSAAAGFAVTSYVATDPTVIPSAVLGSTAPQWIAGISTAASGVAAGLGADLQLLLRSRRQPAIVATTSLGFLAVGVLVSIQILLLDEECVYNLYSPIIFVPHLLLLSL